MTCALAVAVLVSTLAQPGTGGTFSSGISGETQFVVTQGDFPSSELEVITDSTSTFDIRMLNLPGNPRLAMQNIWAYRIEGVDTRERLFTVNQQTSTPTRLSTLFNITGPGGITGTALLVQYLTQFVGDRAALEQVMYVRNTGSVPFQVQIFNYMDLDPNGSTDHAASGAFSGFVMSDGPNTLNWGGFGPAVIEADPYGGPGWVRDKLGDGNIDNLDNTGVPMMGNFTGAMQWTVNVPLVSQVGVRSLTSSVGINTAPIPAPGTMGVACAALMIGVRRRR